MTHSADTPEPASPQAPAPVPCENCGALEVGVFCAQCGQRRLSPRRPLGLVIADAVGTILALDGRVLRTVRDLILRPGAVTRAFIEGRREHYSPPFRLFFLSALVFFLLATSSVFDFASPSPDPTGADATAGQGTTAETGPVEVDLDGLALEPGSLFNAEFTAHVQGQIDKIIALCSREDSSCANHFLTQFQWVVYGMTPIYGLLVALLMAWRRGYYAVDSIVFSLNNHSLVLLAASMSPLLGSVPMVGDMVGNALLVLLTFWFVAAFRRVYATGWLLALGGSLVLFVLWAALFIIAALVTFALGLLTV